MGKGNKPVMPLPAREQQKKAEKTGKVEERKGCNSPGGCLLKEDPPIDCSRNPNFVKVICNNEKCPHNQYLHQQCYDHWEDMIISGVQKSQARTRDWTDDQVRRSMWSRIWDVSGRHCKCLCGGYLKNAKALELVPRAEPPPAPAAAAAAAADGGGQKNKQPKKAKQPDNANGAAAAAASASASSTPKPKQPLPKLVQASKHVYTCNNFVPSWVAAGGRSVNLGAAASGMGKSLDTSVESLPVAAAVQDNYIPGLFVTKETKKKEPPKDNKPRRFSVSEEKAPADVDVFKTPNETPPTTPPPFRRSSMISPSFKLPEEFEDEWEVVKPKWQCVQPKKTKSASPVLLMRNDSEGDQAAAVTPPISSSGRSASESTNGSDGSRPISSIGSMELFSTDQQRQKPTMETYLTNNNAMPPQLFTYANGGRGGGGDAFKYELGDPFADEGPSTSGYTPPPNEPTVSISDDDYMKALDEHIKLSDPRMPYCYARDHHEIQCLLAEMQRPQL